jgi:hypothetical protein
VSFGKGLTEVSTEMLERTLRALAKGELEGPITHQSLLAAGLPALVDRLDHLQGLDARSAQAVIVAVIAERRANERKLEAQRGD